MPLCASLLGFHSLGQAVVYGRRAPPSLNDCSGLGRRTLGRRAGEGLREADDRLLHRNRRLYADHACWGRIVRAQRAVSTSLAEW